MSCDNSMQLHNQLNVAQDKYTYFLLAVAASAIAFATQITKESSFSYSLIPLGLAVLVWGLSFYCGCQNIRYSNTNTIANIELLNLESGEYPEFSKNPKMIQVITEGIKSAFESNSVKLCSYSNWQFRFLIIGSVMFIVWHIFEMAIRTIGN